MTGELQAYTLDRTGRPPLAFEGEFLAGAYGDAYVRDPERGRWHDLELYRSRNGIYVIHIRYRSNWKEEVGFDEALTFPCPPDLVTVLGAWDPAAHLVGYPEGVEHWEKKQERLRGEIRARFARCVSDLFAQLGPEFAERVE